MARPGQAPPTASQRPGRHARPGRGARGLLQGAGVVMVALLVTAVTVVLVREVVQRTAPPPPPAPAPAAPAAPAQPTAGGGGATTTTRAPRTTGAWAGPWRVRPGEGTFVGYRVRGRLAGVAGTGEGVGRTPAVRGRVVLGDTAVEAAEVTADLRELASGDRRGDELAAAALAVERHPEARFELARPVPLGRKPAQGAVLAVRAPGTLTVHGVARPAVFVLEGRWVGDTLELVGRADIRLRDWSVEVPQVADLLALDDQARIELRLRLGRG